MAPSVRVLVLSFAMPVNAILAWDETTEREGVTKHKEGSLQTYLFGALLVRANLLP